MDSRRIRVLERQIAQIKRELMELEELRVGSLSRQYNVCSSPGCRCKSSPRRKHGPYYQLSYTRNRKSTTRAVRRQDLAQVRRQLRNYARLRDLVHRWIDLGTELSALKTAHDPARK
jgi:hypothetical protein